MSRPTPAKPRTTPLAPDSETGEWLPEHRSGGDLAPEDESGRVLAILGGTARKGAWDPPAYLRVTAVMGGVELDFREADLLEGETVIEVFALMGGVSIVVPPHVDVQSGGTGLLGGFTGLSHRAREADAPLLRIEGVAVMAGVDVKVKKLPLKKRLLPG
jgi:hypothetical protein